MFDRSQQKVVAIGIFVLVGVLAVCCFRNPATIGDPQPIDGTRAKELTGKLDPNTADAGSLSSIPGLGEKRAAAIVAYRTRRRREHPHQTVFEVPSDLTNISGIGAATVSNMRGYLRFPSTRSNK